MKLAGCNDLFIVMIQLKFYKIWLKILNLDKQPSWIGPDSIYEFSFVGIEADFVYKQLLNLSTKSNIDVLDFDRKLLRISTPIIFRHLCFFVFQRTIKNPIMTSKDNKQPGQDHKQPNHDLTEPSTTQS